MRKMLAAGVMTLGVVAATGTPAHATEELQGPENFKVNMIYMNGTGCPKGSVTVAVEEDREAFVIAFSKFTAEVGPNAKPTDMRKACKVGISLDIPSDFTYSVTRMVHSGYANLAAGATAQEKSIYNWTGDSSETFTHALKGPYEDSWENVDEVVSGLVTEHPCGEERILNANVAVSVQAGTSNPKKTASFITLDSVETAFSTKVQLKWRKC